MGTAAENKAKSKKRFEDALKKQKKNDKKKDVNLENAKEIKKGKRTATLNDAINAGSMLVGGPVATKVAGYGLSKIAGIGSKYADKAFGTIKGLFRASPKSNSNKQLDKPKNNRILDKPKKLDKPKQLDKPKNNPLTKPKETRVKKPETSIAKVNRNSGNTTRINVPKLRPTLRPTVITGLSALSTPSIASNKTKKVVKKKFQEPDSFPKSKVKQGPPQGIAKKKPLKKKSKSNISGSSSYDADFTEKGLKERGLDPKARMSKENYAKTTTAKNKKNAAGQDFGGKKKKKTAPMYEYGGGKIKMAKGYSAGGKIFTGR